MYSRDAPGTPALRDDEELLEEHWAYMDGFGDSMIARGPTFRSDRETVTASLHVLGLPSVDAVQEFVANEPNNRAAVYAEHSIWRFENALERTMWEFTGTKGEPMFLIIARWDPGLETDTTPRPLRPESLLADLRDRLILYGHLATLDDALPAGLALAVQARQRTEVEGFLAKEHVGLVGLADLEIHDWEFGGRR